MRTLAALALLLAGLEQWTTYACSRASIDGLALADVNAVAAWLFGAIGPLPGLAVNALLTLVAVLFLLRTRLLPRPMRATLLLMLATVTAAGVGGTLGRVAALSLF